MHPDRTQRLLPHKAAPKVEGNIDDGKARSSSEGCRPSSTYAELHSVSKLRCAFLASRGNTEAAGCRLSESVSVTNGLRCHDPGQSSAKASDAGKLAAADALCSKQCRCRSLPTANEPSLLPADAAIESATIAKCIHERCYWATGKLI